MCIDSFFSFFFTRNCLHSVSCHVCVCVWAGCLAYLPSFLFFVFTFSEGTCSDCQQFVLVHRLNIQRMCLIIENIISIALFKWLWFFFEIWTLHILFIIVIYNICNSHLNAHFFLWLVHVSTLLFNIFFRESCIHVYFIY